MKINLNILTSECIEKVNMKFITLLLACVGMLSGCSTTKPFGMEQIDTSISAISQESRVRFLIIHYTVLDQARSIHVLSKEGVSSHYLVGDDFPTKVYQFVDENRVAYHAGVSNWKSHSQLNANSIGIEIVNLGYQKTENGRQYYPYPQYQIDALITLIKDIVKRHNILPENILGHAEIAPQRKPDPGPLFPWDQLAKEGLVNIPNAVEVAIKKEIFERELPDFFWFQKKLSEVGYKTPQTGVWDQETLNVLTAFQCRYRQSSCDGLPDAESAALLEVLTQKTL